jgi:uncharacterized protein YndB with AHSA1/START domain
MEHYRQSLLIQARPSVLYAALTTEAGLRGWWTQDCDVARVPGDTHRMRFGPHHKDLRVEQLQAERLVHWRCTGALIDLPELSRKDEWIGTELVFRLEAQGEGQTRLHFEHPGLVPAIACYEVCAQGWQHFLASLQQYAETGRGMPHALADRCAQ